jgi:hypothetical protein
MTYLQSPAALIVATLLLVSAVRRLWPRVDGPWLTCTCATVCGAVLAAVQTALPWIVAFIAAHAIVGTVLAGAVAGFAAFGGHDLLTGLLAKFGVVAIDARTLPAAQASKSTFEIEVKADTSQASAALDALQKKFEPMIDAMGRTVGTAGTLADPPRTEEVGDELPAVKP